MPQYCCRQDENTLLAMDDLGNGWYQCPKCTGLRRTTNGVVQRISHDDAQAIVDANNRREADERAAAGKLIVGGIAIAALLSFLGR